MAKAARWAVNRAATGMLAASRAWAYARGIPCDSSSYFACISAVVAVPAATQTQCFEDRQRRICDSA
eukprot:748668-Pyramimonas_sp.AAC.1